MEPGRSATKKRKWHSSPRHRSKHRIKRYGEKERRAYSGGERREQLKKSLNEVRRRGGLSERRPPSQSKKGCAARDYLPNAVHGNESR